MGQPPVMSRLLVLVTSYPPQLSDDRPLHTQQSIVNQGLLQDTAFR
jgi:hypothetical protein